MSEVTLRGMQTEVDHKYTLTPLRVSECPLSLTRSVIRHLECLHSLLK